MGDIRVRWDAPLPWHADDGWHSLGLLRPAPDVLPLPQYERARVQLVALRALLDNPERPSKRLNARRGWPSHRVGRADRAWCLIGGLCRITGVCVMGQIDHTLAFECPYEVVREAVLDRALPWSNAGLPCTVGDWNDHPDTDYGHILSTLDSAIAVAETHRDFKAAGTGA